jgi:hypothetical protein
MLYSEWKLYVLWNDVYTRTPEPLPTISNSLLIITAETEQLITFNSKRMPKCPANSLKLWQAPHFG